jgi:hypothetical protein
MLLLSLFIPSFAADIDKDATGKPALTTGTTITTVTVVPAVGLPTTTTTIGGGATPPPATPNVTGPSGTNATSANTIASPATPAGSGAAGATSGSGATASSSGPTGDVLLVLQPWGGLVPDRQFPAGKEFTIALVDTSAVGGTLEVWRSQAGKGCGQADTGAAGYQRLGLVPVSGGLTARVAPVVSGVHLCILTTVNRRVPGGLWEAFRVEVGEKTREALKGSWVPAANGNSDGKTAPTFQASDCTAKTVYNAMQTSKSQLESSLPTGIRLETTSIDQLFAGAVGAAMASCRAYNRAYLTYINSSGPPTPDQALVDAVNEQNSLPAVRIGETFVPFGQALATAKPEELKGAAQALAPLVSSLKQAADWQARLQAAASKKAGPPGPPPGGVAVLLGTDNEYLTWGAFLNDYTRVAHDTLVAQAAASFGAAVVPRPSSHPAEQNVKAFVSALVAHRNRATLEKELKDAEAGLYDAVYKALDPAKVSIAIEMVKLQAAAKSSLPQQTDQEGVYFSTVFGAGPALAFGGTAPEAWAVPYVGVDVYFAPIDRAVAVDDLKKLLFRRLGLTLAVAAYAPVQDVPNRLDKGLLSQTTLLAGVTYRVGRFTNVTAFVVPYKVSPDNPLAEPYQLSTAGGLALSFDADFWSGVKSLINDL